MTKFRIGNGYDVHALAPGLPLVLGGVGIDSPFGCVAHSDGDVAIHALCDALLGAVAAGDIGKHFPDSSEEFRGIDSKLLLSRTVDIVREKGYEVVNADITIAMQAPKLAPYIGKMRETLASVMGVGVEDVSVKATTTERLGFVGRGERVCFYSHISGRTLRAGDRHGTLNLGTPGSPRLNMRSYITLRNNRLVKHWQKTTVPEKVHLDLFWCSNFLYFLYNILNDNRL